MVATPTAERWRVVLFCGLALCAVGVTAALWLSWRARPSSPALERVLPVYLSLDCPRGSKARYSTAKLAADTTLTAEIFGPDVGTSVRLTEPGYLLFIDDQPTADWGHPARLLFVPAAPGSAPTLLFRNTRAVRVVGPGGDQVVLRDTWVRLP